MISKEENDLLTQTSAGKPAGDLLRRYWQPVALSEELPAGAGPRAVTIMGEELVLFRDDRGRPGLLGLRRGARGRDPRSRSVRPLAASRTRRRPAGSPSAR